MQLSVISTERMCGCKCLKLCLIRHRMRDNNRKKTNYVKIPNELKIFLGDDWIIEQAKKLGKQNVVAAGANIYHLGSLSSGEFSDFGRKEKKIFFKHFLPFYKRILGTYESKTHITYFILFMSFSIRKKNH